MEIIEPILYIAEKLCSLCGEVKANKKRCERLCSRVAALVELVRAVKERGPGRDPSAVQRGLRELRLTLECAQELVTKYASASYLKRILRAHDHGDEFGSLNERLNDAAQVLSLALQVDQREKLLEVFREKTRWAQDEADRETDRLELQKLLQSLAEDTKQSVDAMHVKVDSTQKEVSNIKAMLEDLKKPCIIHQDIREIRAEELSYDLTDGPIIKSDTSEIFKGEYSKFAVAIKRYIYTMSTSPSQVRRIFQKEVETMKRFESPNILRMFGICVQDESGPNPNYLIVMEYCEKGSLREVLDSPCRLPWYRKACMSLDAAQGLYRLHQSEETFKVHGCINSSKFLVDAGYRVKLGGFELAKTETSLRKSKDRRNSTLLYSSPEQLENINHTYNKACEMYSFGIVLWEIATRMHPFTDCSSPKELHQRVCVEKVPEPLPEDCPSHLGKLVDACRSYDCFHRPSAGVLVDKLRRVVEELVED